MTINPLYESMVYLPYLQSWVILFVSVASSIDKTLAWNINLSARLPIEIHAAENLPPILPEKVAFQLEQIRENSKDEGKVLTPPKAGLI